MKTSEQEVESFLKEFKARINATGIIIIEREKNLQGMFDLEINPPGRLKILKSLEVSDYYRGPSMQSGWADKVWEFGKKVNDKEAYIKVSMGGENKSVICISFHLAEKAITYPFKK